jgi:large subunit ribosomal protein L33
MAKQDNLVKLECSECKQVNYHTRKNKKKIKDRLELNKYCKQCGEHKKHKETK